MSAHEYSDVVTIVQDNTRMDHDRAIYTSILLREPNKIAMKAYESQGTLPAREADVVVLFRDTGATFTGVVSLTDRRIEGWEHQVGAQANLTAEELEEVDAALRQMPEIIAALAKRGVTDLTEVSLEVWGYPGPLVPEQYRDRRIGWTDVWYRSSPDSNIYANPVSGLAALIDINTLELLELQDTYSINRPPGTMGEYKPRLVPDQTLRTDIKPLEIAQPDGPSFTLDGHHIEWQKWRMRIGFNSREGLTLHKVAYQDGDNLRPIANRMSFAEMIVPYRDASPDHYRRTAFDIGEWGLGFMTTSLKLGCDCLGDIRYLDGVVHNWKGQPVTIENAICIHEEDDAILWKHVDPVTGTEVRRSRRLVISFHATVANYEYLVYWRFYQDGNIECEVRATGIMVTTAFPHGQVPRSGTIVDVDTYAPYHQHFLVGRLDMDIDGDDGNTVYAVESKAMPIGPENEFGLGLITEATKIEVEGYDDPNWHTQKSWKISNPNKTNNLGINPAYKLVPEGAFPPIMDPEAPLLKRASVIGHTIWVTPYDENEKWPAGELVVQSMDDKGMGTWVKQERSVDNTDIVLWYVFGIHHITRQEEWPIMSVDKVSFWLKPTHFFDRNPALDVPPTPTRCEMEAPKD
jgi:primary-amine oxidase